MNVARLTIIFHPLARACRREGTNLPSSRQITHYVSTHIVICCTPERHGRLSHVQPNSLGGSTPWHEYLYVFQPPSLMSGALRPAQLSTLPQTTRRLSLGLTAKSTRS